MTNATAAVYQATTRNKENTKTESVTILLHKVVIALSSYPKFCVQHVFLKILTTKYAKESRENNCSCECPFNLNKLFT